MSAWANGWLRLGAPILAAYGLPAAVFVCTGPIATRRMLWFDAVAARERNPKRVNPTIPVDFVCDHALIAMHGGSGEIGASDWFGHDVDVRASLWSLDELTAAIEAGGFAIGYRVARSPYPEEHPTERLYV